MSRQILAITNYRVSSDEQLKNNSIAKQEKMCLDAVEKLGAKLHKSWSGSVSSKKGRNIDRKDLQEMLDDCKRNRNIKYAIFDELDRFMRSMLEIGYFLVQFRQLGVEVKFASQPDLNADTAANTLMLMLEAFKAEGSNEERQRKSINGQLNALKEGRYTFVPKPGYMRGQQKGIPEVHPVRGLALRKVLIDLAERRTTPTQALIDLNKSEFMDGHSLYKMDKFRKIATDPFYAGVVEIDKQVQFRNENGLHEPLITLAQHNQLVRIFESKKKTQVGPRKNGNPDFPVSNLVTCDLCAEKSNGRYVGFKHSNGKNPKLLYEKYRCRGCGRYISSDDLHGKIEKLFNDNPISSKGSQEVIEALRIVWDREEGQAEQEIIRTQHKIKALQETISSQAIAAIDPSNELVKPEILANVAKKKEELADLESSLIELQSTAEDDREDFMKFAYGFVENMGKHFLDTELVSKENRLRCKNIVFPAGFYVDANNKVYTPETSELYRLAANEKGTEVPSNSLLVPCS